MTVDDSVKENGCDVTNEITQNDEVADIKINLECPKTVLKSTSEVMEDPFLAQSNEELIIESKRDILVGTAAKAVEKMAAVCKRMAEQVGELHVTLAEPYFVYGSALLELARIEACVLGNALDGITEGADDEAEEVNDTQKEAEEPSMSENEKVELSNQIIDAMCEERVLPENKIDTETTLPISNGESSETTVTEPNDIAIDSKTTTEVPVEKSDEAEGSGEDESADGDEEDGENAEESIDSDDVSNLQLAWEMFELSKKLYSEKGVEDKDAQLMLADCFLKLGEINLEKEDPTQALEDFQDCYKILEIHCAPHDRRFAEVRYQMALTKMLQNEYDSAKQYFNECIVCLQLQLDNISSDDEAANKLKNVMAEITELIGECNEEQLDSECRKKKMRTSLSAAFNSFDAGSERLNVSSEAASSSGVTDISSLVRKRKKDVPSSDGVVDPIETTDLDGSTSCCKKIKVDDDVSKVESVSDIVADTNGHLETV